MFKFKEEKKEFIIDTEKINRLQEEIKPFGDFYKLCASKGFITIFQRPKGNAIDFTVNQETVEKFTEYCTINKALEKRNDYFQRKEEEADKQRLSL